MIALARRSQIVFSFPIKQATGHHYDRQQQYINHYLQVIAASEDL